MSTSGTYEFGSPQSKDIIEEAYERVGIIPAELDEQKIIAAQRSLNFILQSWGNRGLKLWTVKQAMLALNANQNSYNLPSYTTAVLDATIRTSTRNLGGTAASSAGGTAQNAFDNNPATACTQTAPNGNISYSWGSTQYAIGMVGVQSNATLTYTLNFQYSNDGATWTTVLSAAAQTYTQGINQWFVIPVPTLGTSFRVIETGGATLNIQELYFNTLLQDTTISPLSRAEYVAIPNKSSTGRPSSYYFDRQISPIIYIWPTPTAQYNNLFYTYEKQIQDIGDMTDSAEIPDRFLEPLCGKLAHLLAIKQSQLDPNRVSILKAEAAEELKFADEEDRERVPIRIYGDYSQGWAQV